MSVTYGFYNSKDGDRLYTAEQMGQLFDGIILDGIFGQYGERFTFKTIPNENRVKIGTGRAWFNGTWILNDEDLILPPTTQPGITQPPVIQRTDSIILTVDKRDAYRMSSIEYVYGNAESGEHPALVKDPEGGIWQYRLFDIAIYPLEGHDVMNGIVEGVSAHITNYIGTGETSYVQAPMSVKNVDEWTTIYKQAFDKALVEEKDRMNAEYQKLVAAVEKFPFLQVVDE